MTAFGDYLREMLATQRMDDDTAEALLAGRVADPDHEPLAALVRAMRDATEPAPRPNAELSAGLASGVFAGPGERYRPPRRGVRAVVARMTGASVLVKAGVAAVAAVLATASAGFAGVLPDAVQDGFETVVESVTPYRFPEPEYAPQDAPHSDPIDPPAGQLPEQDDPRQKSKNGGGYGREGAPGMPAPGSGPGADIRDGARDGGVDGGEVSGQVGPRRTPAPPGHAPAPATAPPGAPADSAPAHSAPADGAPSGSGAPGGPPGGGQLGGGPPS